MPFIKFEIYETYIAKRRMDHLDKLFLVGLGILAFTAFVHFIIEPLIPTV